MGFHADLVFFFFFFCHKKAKPFCSMQILLLTSTFKLLTNNEFSFLC
jgi:hypothetical protein